MTGFIKTDRLNRLNNDIFLDPLRLASILLPMLRTIIYKNLADTSRCEIF